MTPIAPAGRFGEAVIGLDALLRGRFRRAPDGRTSTPLATAAQTLAETLHMKVPPVHQHDGEAPDAYLERFAAANRLRVRRIQLAGGRPSGEAGLLAIGADGHPVVIAPAFLGRAWRLDGTRRRRMTEADWSDCGVEVFALYPIMPDGRLGYRQILTFGLRGGLGDVGLIAGCGLLGSLLAMLPLIGATQIARIGVHSRDLEFLAEILLLLICALAAEAVVMTVAQLLQLRFQGRAALALGAAMVDRMIRLPAAALRGSSQAIIATQMETVAKLRGSVLAIAGAGFLALAQGVTAAALIASHDPAAGLVTIATVLFLVAAAGLIGWAQFRAIYEGERMDVVVLAFAYDLIRLVPVLRAMRAEGRAFTQWSLNFLAFQSRLMRSTQIQNRFKTIESGWDVGATALAFLTIALAGAIGTMDAASAIAFVLILGRMLTAGRELAHGVQAAAKLMPMAKLSRSFLEAGTEPSRPATGPVLRSGRIDVDQVGFAYGGTSVLRDISLSVRDGEFVGIVGPSGSGKSTLLRLLLGLERPGSGRIAYDGHDLSSLDRRSMARHVGASLQNGQLFPGSILGNIAGASMIGLKEAARYADLAGMEDDLRSLPMGLRTLVGEGGAGLSRGQVQRLLLARALAQQPRILILDEAVNALDADAQRQVMQSLARLSMTRLVVSHSPDLLTGADRVVVLQDGRVQDSGPPTDVLGRYAAAQA